MGIPVSKWRAMPVAPSAPIEGGLHGLLLRLASPGDPAHQCQPHHFGTGRFDGAIRWYGALVVGLSLCVACTDSSHELPRQWCGA